MLTTTRLTTLDRLNAYDEAHLTGYGPILADYCRIQAEAGQPNLWYLLTRETNLDDSVDGIIAVIDHGRYNGRLTGELIATLKLIKNDRD